MVRENGTAAKPLRTVELTVVNYSFRLTSFVLAGSRADEQVTRRTTVVSGGETAGYALGVGGVTVVDSLPVRPVREVLCERGVVRSSQIQVEAISVKGTVLVGFVYYPHVDSPSGESGGVLTEEDY